MVTFNPAGRYGNWFFEFATALAYALKNDLKFTVPKQENRDRFWNPTYAHHLYNENWNQNLEEIRLWENGHQYQELPFEEDWRNKNIIIEGYRQSEKYFIEYRDEILSLLGYRWAMNPGIVSIHIRRGDYLHLREKHILYSIEYMRNATSYFYNNGYDHFKVYSDDIAWCREEFSKEDFSAFIIDFSHFTNEEDDIKDMSCCEHHINSSSTFSWAGSWLNRNPDKIVLTPVDWFQPGWMNMDTSNIIPETWIKI